jgi:hypothetical protein
MRRSRKSSRPLGAVDIILLEQRESQMGFSMENDRPQLQWVEHPRHQNHAISPSLAQRPGITHAKPNAANALITKT